MNCCDEYGNCRQGRDCPIRQIREEMAVEDDQDISMLPIIVFVVGIVVAMAILVFGGEWR